MIFFDKYTVDIEGRVFNVVTNKELSYRIDRYGYRYVNLTVKCKSVIRRVHRLIALKYLPLVDGKDCINHIDGNKLNNDLSNLEWITRGDNIRHAHALGLYKNAYKRPPTHSTSNV